MDLAKEVSCRQTYDWDETRWAWPEGTGRQTAARFHVVAVDYGAKRNILRCLASAGCRVTVVPATATGEDILRHSPDGVFLSNGPGDPAATALYAVPAMQAVMAAGVPLFGICLGHQLLALALGAKTFKLDRGHRGANQPVKDLATGRVEITSQNHGFAVDPETLPAEREGDARVAVRRVERGAGVRGPTGLLGAVSPGGEPGAPRQFLSVRAVCGDDGGAAMTDAVRLLLATAFRHSIDEANIESGFDRFRSISGSGIDFAAFCDAVADCVRDRLIHEPVRLEEGSLQCHWRLELTSRGVELARAGR